MTSPLSIAGSGARYIEAPNLCINVGGTDFAYRDLGPRSGVPLVLRHHADFVPKALCFLGA